MSNARGAIKEYYAFSPPVIYPNPTNCIINMYPNAPKGKQIRIKVLNSTGQLLINENLNNQDSSINIQYLPSGLYFVQLVSDNRIIAWKKVFKQ